MGSGEIRSSWGRPASRRTALRTGWGAAAAVGVLGLGAAGCSTVPEGPDPLEEALAAARTDAALARRAADGATPLADALHTVAEHRQAHAEALSTEIRRARPDRTKALADPLAPPPSGSRPDAAAVRTRLVTARDAAAALAPGQSRYRNGLLASVAGSCAGLVETLT